MKETRSLLNSLVVCGVALAMVSTLVAQTATQGTGKVVRLKGAVRYSTGNNVWQPIKVGDVVKPGKDGVSPMSLAEWVEALGTDAPHLFEANAGGGAVGSSAGGTAAGMENPWRKGAENLTQQSILLKTNAPLAKRLMALANK